MKVLLIFSRLVRFMLVVCLWPILSFFWLFSVLLIGIPYILIAPFESLYAYLKYGNKDIDYFITNYVYELLGYLEDLFFDTIPNLILGIK